MSTQTIAPAFSKLELHQGNALWRAASEYPTLQGVILECVQNGIDANSKTITVRVDSKTRTLWIEDDGDGVTQGQFEHALSQVGLSMKERDKLGRFGIGLISPLGKCESFTFTSTPRTRLRSYKEWKFDCNRIQQEQRDIMIPMRERTDLCFTVVHDNNAPGMVRWRTQVKIEKYTIDSRLGAIDPQVIAEKIDSRFGTALRKKKIEVELITLDAKSKTTSIKIVSKGFQGERLNTKRCYDKESGNTFFEMYIAPELNSKRKGRVLIGESKNDFRVEFKNFAKSVEDLLPEETKQALLSGLFEGEILNDRIQLQANREAFVNNSCMIGLCGAIQEWFEEIGRDYYETTKDSKKQERYQDLGLQALQALEEAMKNPEFGNLVNALNSLKHRSTPPQTPTDGIDIPGISSELPPTVTQCPVPTPDKTGKTSGRNGEDKEPKPHSGVGPKPSKIVKSNMGLHFSYEMMKNSRNLYEFEKTSGLIRFNVRHPLWQQCEDHSSRMLIELQQHVAIHTLATLNTEPEWQEYYEIAYKDILEPIMHVRLAHETLIKKVRNKK